MTLQIFKEQVLYYNKARLLRQYMVLFLRHTKQKTQTFEGLGLMFEVSFYYFCFILLHKTPLAMTDYRYQ
jgi:hypothetical protein